MHDDGTGAERQASSRSETPPLSTKERKELRRPSGTRLPLVLVLVSLALAILLPRLAQRRITRLRNDINQLAEPARQHVMEIQLAFAVQASALRGYLLTADETLSTRVVASRARRHVAEQQLLTEVRGLDAPRSSGLTRAATRLLDLDNSLDSIMSLAAGRATSAAALADQRRHWLAIEAVADSLEAAVEVAAESRRATIGNTESAVAFLTASLVLLGLTAAFMVARLGSRFRTLAVRLDEQEARFRQIADNLNDVVWLSDAPFHRILYVNGAYERIWGCSRESLEADPDSMMRGIHPDDRARARASLAEFAHRATDVEFRVIRPDGQTGWVWSRGFPVRDNEGRVFRIAGIIEDITERRQHALERERLLGRERAARTVAEQRRVELERVTESRGRLLRGFTHDVKNPLGAADGYLALLEEGLLGNIGDKPRATVAKVRRSIRQALELIAQLLEIARADAGQLQIRRRSTDVIELVRETADAFRAQADGKDLALAVEASENVPVVETDPTRLRQVVGNLVSNAVKYTPSGGHIAIHVGVRSGDAKMDAGRLQIDVCDDGRGIAEEQLPMLFMEFTRFDPDAAEGTGIGLAISQKIAQALGGEITVDSRIGVGSTFTLHLPIAAD
jgi:PAS domain S-box-containing protein